MESIFDKIWEKKVAFLAVFFVVFTVTYIVFVAVDFLPETPSEEVVEDNEQVKTADEIDSTQSTQAEVSEQTLSEDTVDPDHFVINYQSFPTRIVIDEISKDISVLNPESRTIADLDAALLDGVVRHPDSATLGQEGSVFILGHSSYLPNVFNNNFQAFNGIQNLEWGDVIEVYSEDYVFEYRVEKVYQTTAQDLTVPIAGTEKRLTLATCNSFGSIDDRFIVEAMQIGSKRL